MNEMGDVCGFDLGIIGTEWELVWHDPCGLGHVRCSLNF